MTEAPTEPTDQTPTYQLADLLLRDHGGLVAFVTERRLAGVSLRRLTLEIFMATNKRVDITYETLRSWFPDPRPTDRSPEPGDHGEPNGDTKPEARAS